MPFLATPNGIEVKLIMSQNGVPVVNVWHVENTTPITPSVLSSTLALFDGWLTTDYAGLIQPSVLFQEWIVTDISVAGGAQITGTPTAPNGTAAGVQSAGNAAFVASLRTGLSGRSNRGRTYVPGISVSAFVDAQHVTTVYAAAVNTAFANLVTILVAASQHLAVLSKFLGGVLRVAGLLIEITQIITDTKVDSQRRRTAN